MPELDLPWWQGAVFYQVYVRSFQDTNGDGVGDLPGVLSRLEYLEWLGVDAICLSPIFPSPMVDFGYDVADLCGIDPLFGAMEDFDALIGEAHRRGMRVIIDQIYHTVSSRHPWFVESSSSRVNPKADWFIWSDPRPGGGPPNNWLSFFSGAQPEPAWQWVPARGQYYLHLFSADQCDLNLRHPEVQRELEAAMRFWLGRGVDGFRLDSISVYFKDPALRDYPLREEPFAGSPFSALSRYHVDGNLDRPESLLAAERIRAVLDEYRPERVAVGECASENGAPAYLELCKPGRLHLAFHFELLNAAGLGAAPLKSIIDRTDRLFGGRAWPCYLLGNHDVPRLLSRVLARRPGIPSPPAAKVFAALLLTLRGTPFLYYGEEIGMANTHVPADRLQDPFGKAIWPEPGRDVARTPMQWDRSPNAGFSTSRPWLPTQEAGPSPDVASQAADPDSVLRFYRSLLLLRRRRPELARGRYLPGPAAAGSLAAGGTLADNGSLAAGGVLSYSRQDGSSASDIYLSFHPGPAKHPLRRPGRVLLGTHRPPGAPVAAASPRAGIRLAPFEVLILEPAHPAAAPGQRAAAPGD